MSGGIFEYFSCIVAVGLAIKVIDDYMDDLDDSMNRGDIIYAILALVIATSLDASLAISLFLAAYSLGMLKDLQSTFPWGLRGWQESILVLIWGSYFLGWRCQLSSLAVMMAIQLYDDLADINLDKQRRQPNIVVTWGESEVFLLLAISLSISAFLDPIKTFSSFLAVPIILFIRSSTQREGKGICN